MALRWRYIRATHIRAALSVSGDFVISHRPGQFTLSFRLGKHTPCGTLKTLPEAKRLAERLERWRRTLTANPSAKPASPGRTAAQVAKWKQEERAYDLMRIALGQETPSQVQVRNSAVKIDPTTARRVIRYEQYAGDVTAKEMRTAAEKVFAAEKTSLAQRQKSLTALFGSAPDFPIPEAERASLRDRGAKPKKAPTR